MSGRIDEMLQVRGESVCPAVIDDVLASIHDHGGEHRIITSRARTMDKLLSALPNPGDPRRAWRGTAAEE